MKITRHWHLIDLKGKILGRVATDMAQKLIGKHHPSFSPHLDTGDYVVAINAQDVKFTGKKLTQKTYFRHSGYPGGAKFTTLAAQLKLDPKKVIESAVAGMLPKNKLRHLRLRRLKVFTGPDHSYTDKFVNHKS